ncbi:PLDc N-terminal domain-containing protein [uncultured Mobiluncus sp.]|uniref:PLDc N-terminal domain-containing protein n=1 Tax=uncultured Mobiluncus sp. TaxID=293425 RepID=UPI00288A27D6|nr:PLDc N-terminal domain-containing protein [uncultured Mobiluncus sp.]
MARVLLFILWLALTLYALIDCIRTPKDNMPGKVPKILWILLILLLSPIGAIAWIIVSRVAAAEAKGGVIEPNIWSSEESVPLSFGRKPTPEQPSAPDDDPEFLEEVSRKLREKQREEYESKKRAKEDEKLQPRPDEKSGTEKPTDPENPPDSADSPETKS